MFQRIRAWIQSRNNQIKLEAMSDRLLADIGVERAEIADWLDGDGSDARPISSPLTTRLRAAGTAFVRELRVRPEPTLTR